MAALIALEDGGKGLFAGHGLVRQKASPVRDPFTLSSAILLSFVGLSAPKGG